MGQRAQARCPLFFITILLAVEAADACRSDPFRHTGTNQPGSGDKFGTDQQMSPFVNKCHFGRPSDGKDSIGNSRKRT
jgi:hypothetical protein